MPPRVAIAVFAATIVGLFYLNRDREGRTSPALWIAVAWIFVGASRMVSQWMMDELPVGPLDLYFEGSPIDRMFLSTILISGVLVVMARASRVSRLVLANGPLVVFFLYCLASVLWSDYPFVTFKRWTKACGNVTMILIVLTDPNPRLAMRRVFARTAFLLIPISVLFIKYYPGLGRLYNRWTWTWSSIGVSTDKNGLGALCMVFGLASVWRLVEALRDRANADRLKVASAHAVIIVMSLWLMLAADSSTSLGCFLLGSFVLALTTRPAGLRPINVNLVVATLAIVALAGGLTGFVFQDLYGHVLHSMGRSETLTGRTEIWADLFRMNVNPWLGTGFESFWMGDRAAFLWIKYFFQPNQAHNGFIETYLNLGVIGIGLLVAVIVSGYRNVLESCRRDPSEGSLRLVFLVIALIYSITEAAFKVMHPVWIVFLMAVASTPAVVRSPSLVWSPARRSLFGPLPPIGAPARSR